MSPLAWILLALLALIVVDVLVIASLCRAADLADRQLGYK